MWSLLLHLLFVSLVAFPVFREADEEDLIYNGVLIQFEDSHRTPSRKSNSGKPQPKKEIQKAAETKSVKPTLTQPEKKIEQKRPQKVKKDSGVKSKIVQEKSTVAESSNQEKLNTEKRRNYILDQLKKNAEEEERQKLEAEMLEKRAEMEQKKKVNQMKNAFSQILEKGSNETADYRNIDLSGEELYEQGLNDLGPESTSSADSDLGSRRVLFVPNIVDKSQKQGRVVINICVNAAGNVISAKYTQKGSTTTDPYLINLAEKNALRYRFSESKSPRQCGKVNIDFKVT